MIQRNGSGRRKIEQRKSLKPNGKKKKKGKKKIEFKRSLVQNQGN